MLKKLTYLILASLLSILAFPKFSQSYLAFFSLVPFFLLIYQLKSYKSVLKYSFFCGLLINLGFFYWIVPTFQMAGINFFVSAFACLLISCYLSIYFMIFGCCVYNFKDKYFLISAIFVVLECIRTYMLSGFPWNLLGYSQWNNLLFIQSTSIFGIYWISFLIVLVNLYFVSLINKKRSSKFFMVVLILLSINFGYGFFSINKNFDSHDEKIKFGILQGNIDQYKKFDQAYINHIRNEYLSLLKSMQNIDIFIWPETAYPSMYTENIAPFFGDVKVEAYQIFGAFVNEGDKYFNSALLLDKNLKAVDVYKKNHLVPFGEVFPYKSFFERFLPAIKNVGGVERGFGHQPLDFEGKKIGTSICFETLFGNEIRQFALNGADILVNISNDAWYLRTSAPYQHFSFNIFRAIENRRYLVRAANTGISAVISPNGKILSRTGLYQKKSFVFDVPLVKYITFYTRFGDWFVYFCMLFVLLIIVKKGIIKYRIFCKEK